MTIGGDGISRKDSTDVRVTNPVKSVSTNDRAVRDGDRVTVASGKSPGGRIPVHVRGVASGVGTAYEDIAATTDDNNNVREVGGNKVYVWSSSANDTAAGTGLRAVSITGILTSTKKLATETVATSGATVAPSANTYDVVLFAKGGAVGSGGAQVGTLSIGNAGKTTTYGVLTAPADLDTGEFKHAWYMVPSGYKLVIDLCRVRILDTTSAAEGRLQIKEDGCGWRTVARWPVTAGNNGEQDFRQMEAIPALARVRLQGKALADTDFFFGEIVGTLVPA